MSCSSSDEFENSPDCRLEAEEFYKWQDPVTKKFYQISSRSRKPMTHDELQKARSELPIFDHKEELIAAIRSFQVVVVVGETGSGKSTQMPQFFLEAGVIEGAIAITQPRRVAAVSVCQRVAAEMDTYVGELVGYAIRFEDMTSESTLVKYLTDGLLVMECLKDPLFENYECIILDEAHERTLHTDILLGLLKKAIQKRPELKVIITSATLDIDKFVKYFDNCPVIKIPGKIHPVSVQYLPKPTFNPTTGLLEAHKPLWLRARKPEHYLDLVIDKIQEIHHDENTREGGDILVFLPGREDIETVTTALNTQCEDLVTLQVYAALPYEAQAEIFNAPKKGRRRAILATNIAETSITVDGIHFVIDAGLFKESVYENGIDTLKITTISKAQAAQRTGRAGRTAPGVCYRMYTSTDYNRMPPCPSPAVHRINLISIVLILKSMGIDDVCGFGFMDPPKPDKVAYAMERLKELGAVLPNGDVTDLGYKMAEFPLSPNLSKILLKAAEMECSEEVLTIVAMLSVRHVFNRQRRNVKEADKIKYELFNDYMGDHLSLLNVYNQWMESGCSADWAKACFVSQRELEKALDIRNQLSAIMAVHGIPLINATREKVRNIRRALSTGLPNHVAFRDDSFQWSGRRQGYRTLQNKKLVFIHPSSALYKRREGPEIVVYHEIVTTSSPFMRTVSVCDKSWLPQLTASIHY